MCVKQQNPKQLKHYRAKARTRTRVRDRQIDREMDRERERKTRDQPWKICATRYQKLINKSKQKKKSKKHLAQASQPQIN